MTQWFFIDATDAAQVIRHLQPASGADGLMAVREWADPWAEVFSGDRIVVRVRSDRTGPFWSVVPHLLGVDHPPVPIVLLSWCRQLEFLADAYPKGVVSTVRLPLRARDLAERLAAAVPPSPEEWRSWQQHASLELLEKAAANLRHRLQSMTAAIRLYLGAAARGYVSHADVARVLSVQANGQATEEVELFLGVLEGYIGLLPAAALVTPQAGRRVLPHFVLLDDLALQAGWDVLLGELLTSPIGHWPEIELTPLRSGYTGLSTWSDCLLWLDGPRSCDPQVLLIDCNLGNNQPSGLAALKAIRSRTLELPIMFLTGYDDAQLALWALRAGANHFFAKQLFDANDRASLDYFDHFERLAGASTEVWEIRSRVSQAWRLLQEKEQSGELRKNEKLALRFAFYLLFSHFDGNRWWLYGTADSETSDIASRLGGLVGLAVKIAGGVLPAAVWHGAAFDLVKAVGCLESRIGMLPPWPNPGMHTTPVDPHLPEGCPYGEDELKQEGWRPGGRLPTWPTLELITEPSAEAERTNAGMLTTLDPHGRENGWFDLARNLWPNGVDCFEAPTPQFWASAAAATCAALELYAPTASAGVSIIQDLKSRQPALSVVVVSSSTLSIDAVHAARSGALDYVDKAGLFLDAASTAARQSLQNQVRVAQRLTQRLRPFWEQQRMLETKSLPPALSKLAETLAKGRVPGQVGPVKEWGRELSAVTRFAISIFQVLDLRASSAGAFVAVDQWRTDLLLPRADHAVSPYMGWLAIHAVEQLARWRYCLANRQCFDETRWGSSNPNVTINISRAIETATGEPGRMLWQNRNQEDSKARMTDTLTDMFEAIRQFDDKLANLELLEKKRGRTKPGI